MNDEPIKPIVVEDGDERIELSEADQLALYEMIANMRKTMRRKQVRKDRTAGTHPTKKPGSKRVRKMLREARRHK